MRGFGFKSDCMVLGLADPKASGYTHTGISINKYGWPMYCVEESHVNMFGGGLSGWREQGRFIADYPKLAGIRTGVPWPKWIPNPNGKRRSVIPIAPLWLGLAVNIIFYATLTYGGLFGARATQRWLRGRRALCRQCGYPRPPGGLCPECGQQH